MYIFLLASCLLSASLAADGICVIVRTFVGQKLQLTTLIMSINEAAKNTNIALLFYVLDTDFARA